MQKCFDADWSEAVFKMQRFIKSPDDLEAMKDIMEEHYVDLCNMFKFYCCFEMNEEPFDIQINGVMEFNNECQIPGSGCSTADLDTIFIATNYTAKKQKNNPDRAFVRFQWLEYIARISIAKHSKPALPGDDPLEPPLALDKLMEKNILPLSNTIDSLHLRHALFWTNSFDRLLRDFQTGTLFVFTTFYNLLQPFTTQRHKTAQHKRHACCACCYASFFHSNSFFPSFFPTNFSTNFS